MNDPLSTLRMQLIPASKELLEAAIDGDESLGRVLCVKVVEGWTEFGREPFQYTLNLLEDDKLTVGWVNYFPVLRRDNVLVGSGGFKGRPNDEGWVEIGYEIAPKYRNQGLATEFAMALIDHALNDPDVKGICAHTLGEENASCAVLRKCGFEMTMELEDPEDGVIWRWEWVGG